MFPASGRKWVNTPLFKLACWKQIKKEPYLPIPSPQWMVKWWREVTVLSPRYWFNGTACQRRMPRGCFYRTYRKSFLIFKSRTSWFFRRGEWNVAAIQQVACDVWRGCCCKVFRLVKKFSLNKNVGVVSLVWSPPLISLKDVNESWMRII